VDLGEVTIPGVDWVWDVTSILSILIAFTIGYVIQKVLTLPRVEVYEGPAADIAGAVVGDVTEVVENDIPTDGVDDSRLVVELGPAEDGLDPNYDDPWGDPNDGNDLLPIPGRDIDDDDDEPDEDFYPEYYEGDPTDGFEFQHDEDAPPNEEL
jgi:hypothetical protein